MLTVYPALFHYDNKSYWVEFPDLEGCQTYGSTIEETMYLAQESLGLYLISLEENSQKPNPPSDIKSLPLQNNAFVSMVSCNLDLFRRKNKSIKKTLTIPQWLNEEAEKRHINFSSVLQNALKTEIEKTAK